MALGGQLGGVGLFERGCMSGILLREMDVVQQDDACLIGIKDGRYVDPRVFPAPQRSCREKSTRVNG